MPASCSFRMAMICSSVCLLRFIVWSFLKARLQFTLDQFKGATSPPTQRISASLMATLGRFAGSQSCRCIPRDIAQQKRGDCPLICQQSMRRGIERRVVGADHQPASQQRFPPMFPCVVRFELKTYVHNQIIHGVRCLIYLKSGERISSMVWSVRAPRRSLYHFTVPLFIRYPLGCADEGLNRHAKAATLSGSLDVLGS